ncbi:MAG: hypothetical protein FWG71_01000 [Synergistaceae bacterium]|nr:hypothetical protein [Synergistaceae bacterium]
MSYYEKVTCRIAIQVCIGHFPDGRERHRTFSMRGINPDASFESIDAVIIALAPLLAYPITKVRKVTKREIFFYEEAALPAPVEEVEALTPAPTPAGICRIIPFPVPVPDSLRRYAPPPSRREVLLAPLCEGSAQRAHVHLHSQNSCRYT